MNGFDTKGAVDDLVERLHPYRNEVSIEAALAGALVDISTWLLDRREGTYPNPISEIKRALEEASPRMWDEPEQEGSNQ